MIFDIAGLQAFDFPKALFSRAIEWLLIGVMAALVVRYGMGIVPRTRLHLIAVGFVLANALSALFAENTYIALYGDRDRYMGLTFVIDMAVLYLAVAVGFRRNTDWAIFAIGVGAASVLVMTYAWIQYLGLDPVVWSDDSQTRPFSTLGHADHIGHLLSVVFGAALGLTIAANGRARFVLRIAALVIAAAALGTAAVVATRGTLLGVAAALVIPPILALRTGARLRMAVAAAILTAATAVIVVAGMLTLTPLGARVQRVEESIAIQSRFVLFEVAARAFLQRPVLGYGPDSFGIALPSNRQRNHAQILGDDYFGSAHNWLLQAAATTGAAGILGVLAFALGSCAALWRGIVGPLPLTFGASFVGLIAYWTHGLVAVGSNSVDWVPWVALGAAASLGSQVMSGSWLTHRWRTLLLALCVVASLGAAVSVAPTFAANRDAWAARMFVQSTSDSPNSNVATSAAESAISRDPGRSEYWTWLGIAHGSAGRWEEATAAYEEAAARVPHEWLSWANVARARARSASGPADPRMSQALSAARHAVELDPNASLANVRLSEIAFAAGLNELALQSAVSAISLDPRKDYDAFATRPAARMTDFGRAKELLEQATRVRGTVPLYVALAQTALRSGDTATARASAMRVLQLDPRNADALAVLRQVGG